MSVLHFAALAAAEYIQDTEEYINIELDSSRNTLIRLELIINTATFSIALYGLVAGQPLSDCCPACACSRTHQGHAGLS